MDELDLPTETKIRLGRLRFLGAEAIGLRRDLDAFLEHAYAYDVSIDRDAFRAALALRSYLEDFARDALF